MLGFQVVARLATRLGIEVSLTNTAGATGVTAIISLPPDVFEIAKQPNGVTDSAPAREPCRRDACHHQRSPSAARIFRRPSRVRWRSRRLLSSTTPTLDADLDVDLSR